MDSQWSVIRSQATRVPSKRSRQHGAFADPLERDEWQGLGWSVPLVARLIAGAGGQTKRVQKIKQVERFTELAPSKPVCAS